MTIKVQAKGENAAEILIYGVIGADFFGEGVSAKQFRQDLEALGQVNDISVRIQSPGGNVWDGLAIYNLLKEHEAEVHVHIDGLAASMASVIAMAGDLITMGEGSMMMIHNPATLAFGDGDDMRKAAEMLDKVEAQMVDIYARRTGMKAEAIDQLMAAETWFTDAEAVESGFADERTNETSELAAKSDWERMVARFKNAPESLKSKATVHVVVKGMEGPPSETLMAAIAAQISSNQSADAGATPKEANMSTTAPASAQTAEIEMARKEAAAAALKADADRRGAIKASFGRFSDEHKELLASCLENVECSVEIAREKLLAKLGEGAEPIGRGANIVPGADARDKFMVGAEKALLARSGHGKREEGNEFQGMTLAELAGAALERAGISTRGLSADGKARKVLAVHTSSDFPQLLSNTAGKVLRGAYDNFPNTWQQIAAAGSVSDFKIHPRIQMGSFNNLATIPEGSEYTHGTLAEAYENAQAATKGKAIALTRQMIVNDDLGGFNRRAQVMGRAAARTVNSDLYAFITSGSSNNGPTSTDTGQFFNATAATTAGGHANLTGTGTAITTTSIALGRTTMRKQKDAGNLETLNILPAVLACPVGKEDIAWAVLNSTTDVGQSNAAKKNYAHDVARLQLVTDPYLDGISETAWYLFADPQDAAAAFEVVFLDGNQTPFVDDMIDFDTDSMLFKVRLDYGVAIGDWRGGYKNVGA